MTKHELGTLLDDLSVDVREVDLAERAWQGAEIRRARARRRVLGGAAAAAAVALAGYAWLGPAADSDVRPTGPMPTNQTSGASEPSTRGWKAATDGTRYVVAPALGTEDSLPWTDMGLPPEINSDLPRKSLADVPASLRASARAVYLTPADGRSPVDATAFRPVVVLDDGTQAEVDTVTLERVSDAEGNAHPPLDARAVDAGLRLVFAQPGAVVVVDLWTASVTRVPVPDPHLEWAGWPSSGDPRIVARSADAVWLIDPDAKNVARPTQGEGDAMAGRYAFEAERSSATLDEVNAGVRGRAAVPWPMVEPWGDTMGTARTGARVDWVASAAFLGDTGDKGLDATAPYQGLVAMRTEATPIKEAPEIRLAVFGEDPRRTKGCCRVIGWYPSGQHVLYLTETSTGAHVLAWDVESGTFTRVALVTGRNRVPGLLALGSGFERY
jgi:hypothetical protein